MPNSNVPHVVFSFDHGFRYCSLVSAYSVLKHRNGAPTRITCLVPADMPEMAKALADLAAQCPGSDIRMITDPRMSFDLRGAHRLPSAAYGRLVIPDHCKGRVVYLDGDTLVRRDIAALWGADLAGAPVGAVRDSAVEHSLYTAQNGGEDRRKALIEFYRQNPELADITRYFNSGVMVLDLERIAAMNKTKDVFNIDAARSYKETHQTYFNDQDWMNHNFSGQTKLLGQEWNTFPTVYRTARAPFPTDRQAAYDMARRDPAIVHFTSKKKPWGAFWGGITGSRRRLFKEYRAVMRELDALLGRDMRKDLL